MLLLAMMESFELEYQEELDEERGVVEESSSGLTACDLRGYNTRYHPGSTSLSFLSFADRQCICHPCKHSDCLYNAA